MSDNRAFKNNYVLYIGVGVAIVLLAAAMIFSQLTQVDQPGQRGRGHAGGLSDEPDAGGDRGPVLLLTAPRLIRQDAFSALMHHPDLDGKIDTLLPCILLPARMSAADGSSAVDVTLVGVEPQFWEHFFKGTPPPHNGQAVVTQDLAMELNLQGETPFNVTLSLTPLERPSIFLTPPQKTVSIAVSTITASGTNVIAPRELLVPKSWLAEQLASPDRANAALIQTSQDPQDIAPLIASAFTSSLRLADIGVRVQAKNAERQVRVEPDSLLLPNGPVAAVFRAADRMKTKAARTGFYLADSIERAAKPGRRISYVLLVGIEGESSAPADTSADDGYILPTVWAAKDLSANIGETLNMNFLVPQGESFRTEHSSLRLDSELPLGADSPLPAIPGITGAARIAEWKLSFPVDPKRISARDEQYWKDYGAAAKAVIPLGIVRKMWQSAGSDDFVGFVQVTVPAGADVAAFTKGFESTLLSVLTPAEAGIDVRLIPEPK